MSKSKLYLIIGAVVVVAVIAAIIAFFTLGPSGKQQVATGDPTDIAHDFYSDWLTAAQSTTTNPFKEGLENSPILSTTLKTQINMAHSKGGVDPVICQTTIPEKISTRVVFEATTTTQILVTAAKSVSTSTEQALVTLKALDGGWYIDDISCSAGEFAPQREFSFDNTGYLLKTVPKPLDPKYWYLVFEENGEKGHFAPLFFSASSTCTDVNGKTAVCDPTKFIETGKAHVQGELTETGVQVKKVELLKGN
jgi:hypothetical protein